MKKRVLLIILVLITCLCVGCQTKNDSKSVIYKDDDFQFGLSIANSIDGSYLISQDSSRNHLINFYDTKSEKLVPLCQKANCEHKDMTCNAYQLGSIQGNNQSYTVFSILFYKDRLYLSYIGLSGNTPVLIKSVKKDGSDIRTEYESSELGAINGLSMYKNDLIISKGGIKKNDAGDIIGSSTVNTILLYDLITKEETLIVNKEQKENRMVYQIGAYKNDLYYADINMNTNASEVYMYNMEDNTVNLVTNSEEAPSILFNENYYYLNANNDIINKNIQSNKEELLLHLDEKSLLSVSPQGYVCYYIQKQNGDMMTQIIDLNTNKKIFDKSKKNVNIIGKNDKYYFIQKDNGKLYRFDPKNSKMALL